MLTHRPKAAPSFLSLLVVKVRGSAKWLYHTKEADHNNQSYNRINITGSTSIMSPLPYALAPQRYLLIPPLPLQEPFT